MRVDEGALLEVVVAEPSDEAAEAHVDELHLARDRARIGARVRLWHACYGGLIWMRLT